MQVDASVVGLAETLTWPLVALIILFALKKHVVVLANGATNLNDALRKGGDIMTLLERLGEVKNEAEEIKGMLEAISIKDKGKELQALTTQASNSQESVAKMELSVDEMYEKIEAAWKEVADTIRSIAAASNVRSNLMGTKGVSSTIDALLSKGAISSRAADITKALSSQWQWIFRTSAPREDWLNQQVFASFVEGADQARTSLKKDTVS